MPASIVLQAKTLAKATSNGQPWTEAEIEFVKGSVTWPADEVAEYLGRTLQAVYTERSKVAWTREKAEAGNATGSRREAIPAAHKACGTCFCVHAEGIDCY